MTSPSAACPRCGGLGSVFLCAEYPAAFHGIEASCPVCCAAPAAVVAKWREAHRWSPDMELCRYCGRPTHLHDEHGAPAHKHCVERVSAARAAGDAR